MSHRQRYFNHDYPAFRAQQQQGKPDALQELLLSLTRIITKCDPSSPPPNGWTLSGLYNGPTSTAYLFFQLSSLYPSVQLQGKTLGEWSLAYLSASTLAQVQKKIKVTPSNCGIHNELLCHTAVRAIATHDASLGEKLCSYAPAILTPSATSAPEWLYGYAGYLYLLRLTASAFQPSDPVHQIIQSTISSVIDRILSTPQPWTWHNRAYIGAVHGAFGILVQLVLTKPSLAPKFEALLSELLDLQLPSGNFPTSLTENTGSDTYVQLCHGSPGVAISLDSLRPFYPKLGQKIDKALERARLNVWEKGLLVKQPCLCHGIAGNALAFEDKNQTEYFASLMTEKMMKEVWSEELESEEGFDDACSLYCGEAGRAWVYAVVDKSLKGVCIGYNDV